jgi:hypothetical protein
MDGKSSDIEPISAPPSTAEESIDAHIREKKEREKEFQQFLENHPDCRCRDCEHFGKCGILYLSIMPPWKEEKKKA